MLPKLDEIYADTWDRRNLLLGDISYGDYLKSDHWKAIKLKASKRPNYKKCEFCDSTKVELHHTSYKFIFTKRELINIISLCRSHHQEVHDLAKHKNLSVRIATNQLRRLYAPDYSKPNRITV